MCQQASGPASAAALLADVTDGLCRLASLDMTALTTAEQADCLRAMSRAESQALAARSAMLRAFDDSRGFEDDGAGGSRSWLRWQTQVSTAAAAGAVGWMRRLAVHSAVARALAAGTVSPSWARCICDWSDALGAGDSDRDAADEILLAAARGGAELADLAGLAEEMRRRCAGPDTDAGDDGFRDRSVRLTAYFRGQGQLEGNLTADCTAALRAVLDSLGAKAGPEDLRSPDQRDHDALAEAMRRLIASGCLPGLAGQPATIQLHMTLEQLLGLPGAQHAMAEWAGHGATAPPGAECDARIIPVVTGHVDPQVLDQLAGELLRPGATPGAEPGVADVPAALARTGTGTTARSAAPHARSAAPDPRIAARSAAPDPRIAARSAAPDPSIAAREIVLSRAIRLLSGPCGLAAWLRTTRTTGPVAAVSQPLDVGMPTEVIPPAVRRAIALRDRHCSFPGCEQPPPACQVHHIVPRSEGGVTSLGNCVLLCPFHHLIAIHRWGWRLRLNPDATKTATGPDGRVLHSHSPPAAA